MAFMLPGYTGEDIKKMQDGRLLIQSVKLSIFSKIFDRKIPALESRRARTPSALEVTRDLQ